MEAYMRWVRRNRDYVHSLESLANGLTWLLPERFSESEIGPEAVTSILGVITTINEHILDSAPSKIRTEHVNLCSFPYSLCITLLKDLETLVEVVAQHLFGEEKKWNFIAITEATKVALRLAMLKNSGYKMLLQGGESINEASDSNNSDGHRNRFIPKQGQQGHHGNFKIHQGPAPRNLEGTALSALNRFGENARTGHEPTWLNRVENHQSVTDPPTNVEEKPSLSAFLSEKGIPGGLFLTGEVMFILRPLIYVLLIRKYGARSWFPWLASLAVDLIGNGITSSLRKDWFQQSTNEKNELKRRKLLWALYLMRDPFFTKYTRQKLDGTQKTLEPVPIIGILTEKLVELIIGAQTRYTYMSGS